MKVGTRIKYVVMATAVVTFLSRNPSTAFVQHSRASVATVSKGSTFLRESDNDNNNNNNNNNQNEAERLRAQAEALREQIRKMEKDLPQDRRRPQPPAESTTASRSKPPTSLLDNRRVLVVGANGRLGSMVCRYLLRQHPELKEVIACVHVVGENSDTSRGYGRLSYEVGAEDGIGSIGPAWSSSDERTASFEFNVETMTDYNLQKLRVVECELLDPVQCNSIVEDSQADVVVWCATDFNGNRPRAVSGLNIAFLFRAVSDPTKGRVEVEGLQNMLGAIKNVRQDALRRDRLFGNNVDDTGSAVSTTTASSAVATKPVDVLLVSIAPDALEDFETPFGTFLDQKRQGEEMIPNDFPSLSFTTLQFARYEDNFVGEDLELNFETVDKKSNPDESNSRSKNVRRINRRDAARAVGKALTSPELQGKIVQVWTDELK
ncbi:NAD dependent epimerase/dehydratase family protein [Nitzschia inconspicua]|uniref:NAD dependent epimerase/dehydratase family protein n=1 Tax=Nitzschia inconspicua TaxID=303405 RepID=A0A9K3M2V7_9STRA|nr:NAD dependent epimerase/dehydratase family protein [Nitzschia inconspicua]